MLGFKQFLLLLEDRIDFLKNQFQGKLNTSHDPLAQHTNSNDIIDHFATHADPSHNKMYTNWILNQYQKGHIRQEDHPRINSVLSNFHRYKNRLANKNITDYAHINDLERALEPHLGKVASKKEEKRQIKSEGADLLHSENGVEIRKLKTQEAACEYGKNTKWCTAAKDNNMFNHYNSEGPLYFIKGRNESGELRKYQYHPASGQFMNEEDRPVDIHDFVKRNPELKNVHELAGTHNELPMTSEHREKLANEFVNKLKSGEHLGYEIDRAKKHGYWNEKEHLPLAKKGFDKIINSDNYFSAEIGRAKDHGYWNEEKHLPKVRNWFNKILDTEKFTNRDIDDAKSVGYWNSKEDIPKLKSILDNKIERGDIKDTDIDMAVHNGYWKRKEHPPKLKLMLSKKLESGEFYPVDIKRAKEYRYWNDKEHLPLAKEAFNKKLKSGNFYSNDIYHAKINYIWDYDKHPESYKIGLAKKIESGNFVPDDIEYAKRHGYWDDKLNTLLLNKDEK